MYRINWKILVVLPLCVMLGNSIPSQSILPCENDEFCDLKRCNFLAVREAAYKYFVPLPNSTSNGIEFQFYVQGNRDCQIVLTENTIINHQTGFSYEFLVGGFNNTRTIIRKNLVLTDLQTPNILTSRKLMKIKIQITKDGFLNLFMENRLLAQTFDEQPLNVKYVSFGTFDSADMKFYYNCLPIVSTGGDSNMMPYTSNAQSYYQSQQKIQQTWPAFYTIWTLIQIFGITLCI